MQIIHYRTWWYTISGILLAGSIVALVLFGLQLGIDFTGGSLLEVRYHDVARPAIQDIQSQLQPINLGPVNVQPIGETNMLLKFKDVSEETHQSILSVLRQNHSEEKIIEERFESLGPSIGKELQQKTLWAIGLALVMILVYIAWAFRKVSDPVSSWVYGIAALAALFHDLLIPLGVFAVLGRLFSLDIGTPFVAALLTVLGYSINDTIVVFDRVRENIPKSRDSFLETVNRSVNETLWRSINTTLTTLLVLLALFFFGGETIRYFALALIIGIASGAYSSIFIASPFLVTWDAWRRRDG